MATILLVEDNEMNRDVLSRLGSRKDSVLPVFISVDPARDTPEHLAAYAKAFSPAIRALTGSERQLRRVAKAYGAVCTPDFFGFNAALELQYRGRLDESRKETAPDARRELFEAMKQVALTGSGPQEQIASIGCSIKWKDA